VATELLRNISDHSKGGNCGWCSTTLHQFLQSRMSFFYTCSTLVKQISPGQWLKGPSMQCFGWTLLQVCLHLLSDCFVKGTLEGLRHMLWEPLKSDNWDVGGYCWWCRAIRFLVRPEAGYSMFSEFFRINACHGVMKLRPCDRILSNEMMRICITGSKDISTKAGWQGVCGKDWVTDMPSSNVRHFTAVSNMIKDTFSGHCRGPRMVKA